ncbi:spore gernimation protein KA [Halalkalibacillus sediminis]|uniref:Spore gernimation protein KA n=1 Tax=Halalkalibacillus sediminis TaxID=2018042 RepID=A0A2I0QVE3_9BACI|nr:spore germination protein GerPB [Halalkalibacillus sediminis]PKR78312.1 spore gernimation protein KA [Halalkalibacillus sediminis]
MSFTVHQQIHIQFLKVGSVTNSSVLQVGSTGCLQAVSNAYNTGGFTEPARPAEAIEDFVPVIPIPHIPFTDS